MKKNTPKIYNTLILFFIVQMCFTSTAISQIYEYVDENGKTHYTDNKSKIPEQYRNQTEKFLKTTTPKNKNSKKKPVQKTSQTKKTKSVLVEDQKPSYTGSFSTYSQKKPKLSDSKPTYQPFSFRITPSKRSSSSRGIRKGSGY